VLLGGKEGGGIPSEKGDLDCSGDIREGKGAMPDRNLEVHDLRENR